MQNFDLKLIFSFGFPTTDAAKRCLTTYRENLGGNFRAIRAWAIAAVPAIRKGFLLEPTQTDAPQYLKSNNAPTTLRDDKLSKLFGENSTPAECPVTDKPSRPPDVVVAIFRDGSEADALRFHHGEYFDEALYRSTEAVELPEL